MSFIANPDFDLYSMPHHKIILKTLDTKCKGVLIKYRQYINLYHIKKIHVERMIYMYIFIFYFI